MIKIHLSRLMGERKMNRAELSRKTGINANTIGDYYSEIVDRVSLRHLSKMCKVLGCAIHELMEYIPTGEDELGQPGKPAKAVKSRQ